MSMSMSMSAAGAQGGLLRELDALEEIDTLRAENAAMHVVLKQMAAELDGGPRGTDAAAPVGHSEVILLRRQLQEERVGRRAAAREARHREEQLRLRVEELERMLGEALADVTQAIDASLSQSTTGLGWADTDQTDSAWGVGVGQEAEEAVSDRRLASGQGHPDSPATGMGARSHGVCRQLLVEWTIPLASRRQPSMARRSLWRVSARCRSAMAMRAIAHPCHRQLR